MALTVQLAENVWRVPLLGPWFNGFLFRDAHGITMLDMGFARSGTRMVRALESIGSDSSEVTRLLLTHCHPDHAGGATRVAQVTGKQVAVHGQDADYLRTGVQPPRDPAFQSSLFAWLRRSGTDGHTGPRVPVGEELHDGQLLDVAGGLRVVHTPGHTPGHVSFLHEELKLLITGDAIFNVLGVRWPLKSRCTDFRMTQRTAHELAELDYDVAAFTHGPPISDHPRDAIRNFLRKNPAPAE